MSEPDAVASVAPPKWTTEGLLASIRGALRAGDMPAAASLIRVLAVYDPDAADLIRLAAKAGEQRG